MPGSQGEKFALHGEDDFAACTGSHDLLRGRGGFGEGNV